MLDAFTGLCFSQHRVGCIFRVLDGVLGASFKVLDAIFRVLDRVLDAFLRCWMHLQGCVLANTMLDAFSGCWMGCWVLF